MIHWFAATLRLMLFVPTIMMYRVSGVVVVVLAQAVASSMVNVFVSWYCSIFSISRYPWIMIISESPMKLIFCCCVGFLFLAFTSFSARSWLVAFSFRRSFFWFLFSSFSCCNCCFVCSSSASAVSSLVLSRRLSDCIWSSLVLIPLFSCLISLFC